MKESGRFCSLVAGLFRPQSVFKFRSCWRSLSQNLLPFKDQILLRCVRRTHLCVHLSISGYSGCFHFWAVVNSAAANTGEHVSRVCVCIRAFSRSGYKPGGGMAVRCPSPWLHLSFLLLAMCRVPVAPLSHQQLSFIFL